MELMKMAKSKNKYYASVIINNDEENAQSLGYFSSRKKLDEALNRERRKAYLNSWNIRFVIGVEPVYSSKDGKIDPTIKQLPI
jgi:hypothetical protein